MRSPWDSNSGLNYSKACAKTVCITNTLEKKIIPSLRSPLDTSQTLLCSGTASGLILTHSSEIEKVFPLTCSRVNILPGSCSTKHIIHFFQLWILPVCYLAPDVVHVGAGVAGEAVAALPLLDDQPVPQPGQKSRMAATRPALPAEPAAASFWNLFTFPSNI